MINWRSYRDQTTRVRIGGVTFGDSVVSETDFGQSPNAGVSTDAARADHTHGSPANPVEAEVTYKISDIDDSGDPEYFGYVAADGSWMIVRMAEDGTTRYAGGGSGYSAAWSAKESQSYDYYDVIF